jgi:hypothetical protein
MGQAEQRRIEKIRTLIDSGSYEAAGLLAIGEEHDEDEDGDDDEGEGRGE